MTLLKQTAFFSKALISVQELFIVYTNSKTHLLKLFHL